MREVAIKMLAARVAATTGTTWELANSRGTHRTEMRGHGLREATNGCDCAVVGRDRLRFVASATQYLVHTPGAITRQVNCDIDEAQCPEVAHYLSAPRLFKQLG